MAVVVIDSREPEWIKKLPFGDCATTVSTLDVGDLQVIRDDNTMIFVERKTASDLVASIEDGRLQKQCAAMGEVMREAYSHEEGRRITSILFVTGQLSPRRGKTVLEGVEINWKWASIQGALLSAQAYGVQVYFGESDYDVEPFILSLLKKELFGSFYLKPTKEHKDLSQTINMLANLPGIGLQKAVMLSERSNDNLIDALRIASDKDMKLPGIGEKTKQAIRKAIGIADNETILVADIVDGENYLKE